MNHNDTPIFNSLKKHIDENIIPFHVPGHKHGHGSHELLRFFGKNLLHSDLNAMQDIDDLSNPTSCILESEKLLADAFSAEHAFILTNGTTSGIHGMMLASLKPGDKIILPRNAHKSVISGLILTGAIPIYIYPELDKETGVSTNISVESVENKFKNESNVRASFFINPSYYGYAANIEKLVTISHQHNALVMVDEAHGSHMKFHPEFPASAMNAGADLSSVSMHKTSGSLTQSSVLLQQGKRISPEKIKQSLNLIRSTSASYPLMLSVELARKNLVLHGYNQLSKCIELTNYSRKKINSIKGLYAFGSELMSKTKWIHFDPTKLNIYVRKLGLTGFEIEAILRNRYHIQVELSELNTIMAIITIGDSESNIEKLISALTKIAQNQKSLSSIQQIPKPEIPDLVIIPRDAFYRKKKRIPLSQSVGEISGEMIMAYPPGIPIICPGERVTREIIDYIHLLKEQKCTLQGNSDPYINSISILG